MGYDSSCTVISTILALTVRGDKNLEEIKGCCFVIEQVTTSHCGVALKLVKDKKYQQNNSKS